MKYKNIVYVVLAALLCVSSCGKNEIREPKDSIFKNDVLKGISANIGHYRRNNAFTLEETNRGQFDPEQFPGWWYTAKNDDIEVAFWPNSYAANKTGEFSLQFVDFKQNSDRYFLSQFIGMPEELLLDKYPNPDINFDRDYEDTGGQNHIIYYSADKKRFVHFWFKGNTVSKVGFAYSLPESSER